MSSHSAPLIVVTVACVAAAGFAGVARSPSAPSLALPGRAAPELARVLTPRHVPPGTYSASVLAGGIGPAKTMVQKALGVELTPNRPEGSWQVESQDCVQTFGSAADFDRSRLARLCRGRPLAVVRGPVTRGGATVASVTLVSPYPNASLTRLEPGTLVILFDVARARQGTAR